MPEPLNLLSMIFCLLLDAAKKGGLHNERAEAAYCSIIESIAKAGTTNPDVANQTIICIRGLLAGEIDDLLEADDPFND